MNFSLLPPLNSHSKRWRAGIRGEEMEGSPPTRPPLPLGAIRLAQGDLTPFMMGLAQGCTTLEPSPQLLSLN